MTLSRFVAFMALAAGAWAGGPLQLSAQPAAQGYDPKEYAAPTPDVPADIMPMPGPLNPPPDQDPRAAPDLTFRDRLQKLRAGVPGANVGTPVATPGMTPITTPDTTSSYTTSQPANGATHDTTSSYTTGDRMGH
jgi:hypothetical protein